MFDDITLNVNGEVAGDPNVVVAEGQIVTDKLNDKDSSASDISYFITEENKIKKIKDWLLVEANNLWHKNNNLTGLIGFGSLVTMLKQMGFTEPEAKKAAQQIIKTLPDTVKVIAGSPPTTMIDVNKFFSLPNSDDILLQDIYNAKAVKDDTKTMRDLCATNADANGNINDADFIKILRQYAMGIFGDSDDKISKWNLSSAINNIKTTMGIDIKKPININQTNALLKYAMDMQLVDISDQYDIQKPTYSIPAGENEKMRQQCQDWSDEKGEMTDENFKNIIKEMAEEGDKISKREGGTTSTWGNYAQYDYQKIMQNVKNIMGITGTLKMRDFKGKDRFYALAVSINHQITNADQQDTYRPYQA